jgi:hypothetical protein
MRRAGAFLVALVSLVVSCGGHSQQAVPAAPLAQDVETTFYLIGDAGAPDRGGEPVLEALQADLAETQNPTVVVFLGDNLYPAGMPPADSPDRPEAERRLHDQIDAVRSASHAFFVPGNHDWNYAGDDGFARLIEQEKFGRSVAAPNTEWIPGNACPGPAIRDFGNVRILAIDTQWWLGSERPAASATLCAAHTERQVLDSIRTALAGAGERRVFVLAHHPMVSGGTHGGHFSVRQHLFPLTDVKPWLWLPLPVIGSAYPISRKLGLSDQDMSSDRYRAMRDSLESALRASQPILYASGHDHSLQVLHGIGARYQIVTGAGIYGHNTPVHWIDRTVFAAPGRSGYTRVEVQRDGRVRLASVLVAADGARTEGFSIFLE